MLGVMTPKIGFEKLQEMPNRRLVNESPDDFALRMLNLPEKELAGGLKARNPSEFILTGDIENDVSIITDLVEEKIRALHLQLEPVDLIQIVADTLEILQKMSNLLQESTLEEIQAAVSVLVARHDLRAER